MKARILTNWYISDPHFGHDNIIAQCERPFKDTDEMAAAMIANFNSVVKPDDNLWIIGDFSCNRNAKDGPYLNNIFSALNGNKHLIIGNHDTKQVLELPWSSTQQQIQIKDHGQFFFLNHYPMITWPASRHGCIQLFGHIHNNWSGSRNAINMSVEHWNYKPVSAKEIIARSTTLPVNPLWNDVEPGL